MSYNSTTINQKLDDLYRSYYGTRYGSIILCGVVDERVYKSTTPKIVFILRESRSSDGGWSIPYELSQIIADYRCNGKPLDPAYMPTWRQAGVWAYSILHGFSSYDALKGDRFVARGLEAIAMTNLKKTGGGATSNLPVIRRCATQEKALWQKEIETMNPDLIICGGTYWDVRDNLGLPAHKLATINQQPYYYSVYDVQYREHGHVILDFWHPTIRKSRGDTLKHLETLIDRLRAGGLLWWQV